MSTSRELQTLKTCTPQLETLLKHPERDLVHFLSQKSLISESVQEDVLNPRSMLTERQKAGMLVDGIKDAVSLDKELYYILLRYFEGKGAHYKPVVETLTKTLSEAEVAVQESSPEEGSGIERKR